MILGVCVSVLLLCIPLSEGTGLSGVINSSCVKLHGAVSREQAGHWANAACVNQTDQKCSYFSAISIKGVVPG